MGRRGVRDNDGVSYDQRTGKQVPGRKLRQDGEIGIWTTKPDQRHPQRYVRVPGPDGLGWRPGQRANESIGDVWPLYASTWTPITMTFFNHPHMRASVGGGFSES